MSRTTIAPRVEPIKPAPVEVEAIAGDQVEDQPADEGPDHPGDEQLPLSHSHARDRRASWRRYPATSAMTMNARIIMKAPLEIPPLRSQYWKSNSRYLGSGHRSSATMVSSSSATSRSVFWAGITFSTNALASSWTDVASWASCWACSRSAIAAPSRSVSSATLAHSRFGGARDRPDRVQLREVAHRCGHDHRPGDVERRAGLDAPDLDVALPRDVDARRELAVRQHAQPREDLLGLRRVERRQRVNRCLVVGQTAPLRLGVPFVGVVVALEEDLLVAPDDRRQDRGQAVEVLRLRASRARPRDAPSESATATFRTVCGQ